MTNLFADLPSNLSSELTDILVQNDSVRIERIVSTGQKSPDDFWYDQNENEWVIVLKGEAELQFEGQTEPLRMRPGDCYEIDARIKHRVQWTSETEPTVWLAVFYKAKQTS